ncbi:MAG: hypothetical protein ACOCXJ_04350, partial [Planctomycetota bacterium]
MTRRLIIGLGVCGQGLVRAWQAAGDRVCGISRQARADLPQVTGDAAEEAVLAAAEQQLQAAPATGVLCAG